MNVNDRRYPGTRCLLLITTHNIQVALKHDSEPYHRRHIRNHQSRIADFNDSTPTSSSHPELRIYSPNYDSVDWDYYYGDLSDNDFYGEWYYYYDYEPKSETYNYGDDWDQVHWDEVYDKPNIQQPILSTIIED